MSGGESVKAAIGSGNNARGRAEFDYVVALYKQFHDVYHGWTASLYVHLNDEYGHENAV